MSYADEAVKRGSLAVAACNGRDSIAMCLERPTTASFDASSSASATTSTSTTRKSEQRPDDDASVGEHGGKGRRRKRRRHGGGGVRDPGVGVGIVDSANNQDRKLCEVCMVQAIPAAISQPTITRGHLPRASLAVLGGSVAAQVA